MAKVLACPACGNKHPLDLLAGLDSFLCKNCGKKLAVPLVAAQPKKPVVRAPQSISQVPRKTDEPDVVVVARSSISSDEISNSEIKPDQNETNQISQSVPTTKAPQTELGDVQVVAKSRPSDLIAANNANSTNPKASQPFQKRKSNINIFGGLFGGLADLALVPIPIVGRVISWFIAIPAGFFLVVLLPRFFGFGFHASDFVGVITNQGINRYSIVVELILLWSITSVLSVSVFNLLLRKLFLARKFAT